MRLRVLLTNYFHFVIRQPSCHWTLYEYNDIKNVKNDPISSARARSQLPSSASSRHSASWLSQCSCRWEIYARPADRSVLLCQLLRMWKLDFRVITKWHWPCGCIRRPLKKMNPGREVSLSVGICILRVRRLPGCSWMLCSCWSSRNPINNLLKGGWSYLANYWTSGPTYRMDRISGTRFMLVSCSLMRGSCWGACNVEIWLKVLPSDVSTSHKSLVLTVEHAPLVHIE
jgi:hypothetical protein